MEHLFCNCQIPRTFYMHIVEWALQMGLTMPSNDFDSIVLQNVDTEIVNNNLSHLFALTYKMMVFGNRENPEENTLYVFRSRIASLEKIERKIASKNGKIVYHLRKWSLYLDSIKNEI